MLMEYVNKAFGKAKYKKPDDGSRFSDILGFEGVRGNAKTVEDCTKELFELLEEWLVL